MKKRLFPTQNAFHVYAALADLLDKNGKDKGILIAEIAGKAKITYGSAYYWCKIFSSFGFINRTREERRSSNTVKRRQIVIRWNQMKSIKELEILVDCDGWLMEYIEICKPPLPRDWPLPKE